MNLLRVNEIKIVFIIFSIDYARLPIIIFLITFYFFDVSQVSVLLFINACFFNLFMLQQFVIF